MNLNLKFAALLIFFISAFTFSCNTPQQTAHTTAKQEVGTIKDPLPSWNEGASKKAIMDFVARTTKAGSTDFIPIPERIACFDNDGTLWSEQPMYFQ